MRSTYLSIRAFLFGPATHIATPPPSIMDWFGHAEINFTHARYPRLIREKDGFETDLLKIVEQSTPPCNLNPLLFNGHLQTMWTATRPTGPKVYYKRRIFEADHETYSGTFAVDFVCPPHDLEDASLWRRTVYFTEQELQSMPSDDSKPMLVVLHGLSGGSHEIYLRHCLAPLTGDGKWEACVVNFRGCARHKITSGVLYNARATWDLRQTIEWLRKTFPNRPLFGLGFSLGANMLTNASCLTGRCVVGLANMRCSTAVKKAPTARSRVLLCVRTPSTSRFRARCSKTATLAERFTSV